MITAIVSGVLIFFIQTIINCCLKGSVEIGKLVLSEVTSIFTSDDPFTSIMNLIPSKTDLKISSIVFAFAFAIVMLLLFLEIYRSLIGTVTGQQADNPVMPFVRAICVIIFILIFYGNTSSLIKNNIGILPQLSKIFIKPLDVIIPKIDELNKAAEFAGFQFTSGSANITAFVGMIIISGGILGATISGALSVLERAVTLAMYIILGPICLAFYTSKATAQAAIEWMKGLIIQFLTLDFSLILWGASMAQLVKFFEALNTDSLIKALENVVDGSIFNEAIPIGAVCIILLSITGNMEEIFGSLGFHMMSGLDSARLVGNGFRTATSTFHTVQTAARDMKVGGAIGKAVATAGDKLGSEKLFNFGNSMMQSAKMTPIDSMNVGFGKKQMGDGSTYHCGQSPSLQTANNLAANARTAFNKAKGAPIYGSAGEISNSQFGNVASALEKMNPMAMPDPMALTEGTTAASAAASMSQIADVSNNRMTDDEKAIKSNTLGECFAENDSGFMTVARDANGNETPVFCGELKDGSFGITNGGSSMQGITSMKNSDGEWMDVNTSLLKDENGEWMEVDRRDTNIYDKDKKVIGQETQIRKAFSPDQNGNLSAGVSPDQVMRINIDPSFKNAKASAFNKNVEIIMPEAKKQFKIDDVMQNTSATPKSSRKR